MSYDIQNNQYGASGSGQHQQASGSQQAQQQYTQPLGSPMDPYQAQFFTDPRYQVPPSFLDDPPRGPDNVPRLPNGAPQYTMNMQQQMLPPQDPSSWANYLRLPTGFTPPVSDQQASRSNLDAYASLNPSAAYNVVNPTASSESSTASYLVSSFPSMSLEGNPPSSVENPLFQPETMITNRALAHSTSSPEDAAAVARRSLQSSVQSQSPSQPPQLQRNDTPPTVPGPLLYSSSGFDMIGVLARVASRKDPQVLLGPVDFTCSFVVSDATKPDEPIVYCSPTFVRMLSCCI